MKKPNFALDLSCDAIALQQRSETGDWHPVGKVALDAPDLGPALAALHRTAEARAPDGMRSEIVIPDDQIRYVAVPADAAPDGDHDAAAAQALDGATPYALDELAWDWTLRGDTLQVAAVARETLDEAESFAREHRFNPVRFTARPPADVFDGIPDFGATALAEAEDTPNPDAATAEAGPDQAGAAAEPDTAKTGTDQTAAATFASRRAARGAKPATGSDAPPADLPEAEAREISGAAMASLAPRDDAADTPEETPAPAPERRRGERPSAAKTAAPPVGNRGATKADEAERMTIFGARSDRDAKRRSSRSPGFALIAAVLVAVFGVAGWALVFPGSELGQLLRGSEPQVAVTPDMPDMADGTAAADLPETAGAGDMPPEPDARDSAALPAPDAPAPPVETTDRDRPLPIVSWSPPRNAEEARERYAKTGVWPVAPGAPPEPRGGSLETFYQTSIDSDVDIGDAVALDIPLDRDGNARPGRPVLPPPPDRTFELDSRGFVRATPEGALTPDGVRVFAGPPPARQPETPVRQVPVPGLSLTEEAAEALETLSTTRPRLRPETLLEEYERGALGGRSRNELAAMRPRERPDEMARQAAAPAPAPAPDQEAIETAVALAAREEAIAESLKPRPRPAEVRAAARAVVAPRIPTSASVARQATERNAVNLRQVNLIGVYGTRADRRALVRLPNGSYRRVKVGDRIDGGRVAAIGNTELRYVKSGRNVVLKMPRG